MHASFRGFAHGHGAPPAPHHHAAGVYNQKKWLAFVAGILGTTALALAGLATYARKLAAENDAKLRRLREAFSERARRADARPGNSSGGGGGDGVGAQGR
ncbi:hypothetical protein ABPG75_008296 [Micractinium tetrahymenae]